MTSIAMWIALRGISVVAGVVRGPEVHRASPSPGPPRRDRSRVSISTDGNQQAMGIIFRQRSATIF
jgi:hypothetical protein